MRWPKILKLPRRYAWVFDFFDYVQGRIISGLIGTLVLYIFADRFNYSAWLINLLWIPFAFAFSFAHMRTISRTRRISIMDKVKIFILEDADAEKS